MKIEFTQTELKGLIREHLTRTMPELLKGKSISEVTIGSRYDSVALSLEIVDEHRPDGAAE